MGVTRRGLVALFGAFVAVQLPAMFGGSDYVTRTAGLTYAECAKVPRAVTGWVVCDARAQGGSNRMTFPPQGNNPWRPPENAGRPELGPPMPYPSLEQTQWAGPVPPMPPAPVEKPGTNGFAITSLVLGILGIFGITAVLSVIFGIIALRQTGRQRQRGKGLAVAGLSVSAVWVGFWALAAIGWYLEETERDSNGEVRGGVAPEDLKTGDCMEDALEESKRVLRVPVVPCDEPHHGEVFAVLEMDDGDWPGEDVVWQAAEEGCAPALEEYAATAFEDTQVELFSFHPVERSWRRGDREIVCVAHFLDGPRTGSIREE